MGTEADTCRTLVLPKLYAAGWADEQLAIERAVQALLRGQRRVLLTMATGTGKTVVAFQICWKLWSSRWNRPVSRKAETRAKTIVCCVDQEHARKAKVQTPNAEVNGTRMVSAFCLQPSALPSVVLVRLVNSMVEFKQIIGRGTRVRDDYGKVEGKAKAQRPNAKVNSLQSPSAFPPHAP